MAQVSRIWRWGPVRRSNAIAAGNIRPGSLVERITAAGADQGKVQAHASAGGRAEPLFADVNGPYGGPLYDNYLAGESVPLLAPQVGSIVFARGSPGVIIHRGQARESSGNGTVRPLTIGVVVGVAVAEELATGDPVTNYVQRRITAS